jgi:hypothetical protein
MYKLWVNIDYEGNIANGYGGYEKYVGEPLEPYDYYFEVTDVVYKTIGQYKVSNGELVLKG